jgi:hypothetical protein
VITDQHACSFQAAMPNNWRWPCVWTLFGWSPLFGVPMLASALQYNFMPMLRLDVGGLKPHQYFGSPLHWQSHPRQKSNRHGLVAKYFWSVSTVLQFFFKIPQFQILWHVWKWLKTALLNINTSLCLKTCYFWSIGKTTLDLFFWNWSIARRCIKYYGIVRACKHVSLR